MREWTCMCVRVSVYVGMPHAPLDYLALTAIQTTNPKRAPTATANLTSVLRQPANFTVVAALTTNLNFFTISVVMGAGLG